MVGRPRNGVSPAARERRARYRVDDDWRRRCGTPHQSSLGSLDLLVTQQTGATHVHENMSKRVLTYGTFDFLHIGHINILRRAKELGDYLIVGLSTDTFNRLKHKQSFSSFEERKQILEAIRFVDKVIPEETWEQKIDDIRRHEIDLFVMGDDWSGKFDHLREYCEVLYLPRTENISSTLIRNGLST